MAAAWQLNCNEQTRRLDGVNLVPYLSGEKNGIPHQRLYWRKLDCAAVRDGHWKLIRVDDYGFALYNLTDDIAERKDLAAQQPEKVSQLRGLLEAWEQDKIPPLWHEGEHYKVMRFRYHTERFKTGVNPEYDKVRRKKE